MHCLLNCLQSGARYPSPGNSEASGRCILLKIRSTTQHVPLQCRFKVKFLNSHGSEFLSPVLVVGLESKVRGDAIPMCCRVIFCMKIPLH